MEESRPNPNDSGSSVAVVPDGQTPEAVRELGEAIAKYLMTREDGSITVAERAPGASAVGGGLGGFEGFGLSVTYKGTEYDLSVVPPVVDGNGWSFSLLDKENNVVVATLASFLFVSSKTWSVAAGVPPQSNIFNSGISIRQVAIDLGAGPEATFTPASAKAGETFKLSAVDFPEATLTVSVKLVSNADGTITELKDTAPLVKGKCTDAPITLKDKQDKLVPIGNYSVHVVDGTVDGATIPAGSRVGTSRTPVAVLTVTAAG
jgi:hypothetical protein